MDPARFGAPDALPMTAGMQRRVTDGAARGRRLGYALGEGYVLPQERTLADKLALTAAIAGLVRFPGGDGTWARLFAQEPAVVMAELMAVQPEARRAEFAALIEADPAAAATGLRSFARQVALWLGRAAGPGRGLFAAQLAAIDGRATLTGLVRDLAEATDVRPASLAARVLAVAGSGPPPADAIGRARAARDALVQGYELLLNIVAALRPGVVRAFEARLASGQIDPALGLILAELELLGEVEARINRFTDRHADYYFAEVLGQAPRPATPESVLLRFTAGAAPVAIEEGASLLARLAGSPEVQRYRLVEGLRVAPVRVAEARSLRFHRDPLISPQSEMGFVTGLSLAALKPEGGGEGQRLFAPAAQTDVAMGLSIASPMLLLAEGRRRIEVRLVFERRQDAEAPGESGDASVAAVVGADPAAFAPFGLGAEAVAVIGGWVERLAAEAGAAPAQELVYHACLRAAETPEQVQAIYGRIVAATLIEGRPWPTGGFRETLLARIAAQLGGEATAAVAAAMLDRPRAEAFQTLLQDAFELTLSGEAGPVPVDVARVAPNPEGEPGITFRLHLDETAPPVAPPPGAAAPELTIRMAGQGRFCPFSLFEPFALEAIGIAVRVEGLVRLAAFSDDGPLNTAQPFMPFGARPKDGATFLVGAPELAAKPVTRVGVNVTWADLPRAGGGFEEHYRDYGEGFRAPDPKLAFAYLTGEGWKGLGEPVPMVRRSAPGGPLLARQSLEARIPGRPVAAGGPPGDFRERHGIRAGLASLVLDCPGEAFGHAAYPAALAQAMRPTLRPLAQRPIPPLPWTPLVSEISLDYSARAEIALDAPQAARPGERVAQIGPFGAQEMFPKRTRPGAGLFPARLADATLFVRIEGPGATGPVSLLFEMQASSLQRTAFQPEPVGWRYLTGAGWQPLPSWSLASDSTDGLMRSGVVTIDVPDEDVVLHGGEMPGEGVWLAASADRHLDAFPRLVSLSTNGGRSERVDPAGAAAPAAARSFALDPPRPGLGAIVQVGPAIGGAPAETRDEFRARVAERLRHRARAVTAWDVERLVLDAFPQVWKAKCFPALEGQAPGRVTVVVVPGAPDDARAAPGQVRMFDVLMLRRIEGWLTERASPFACIEVRNPSYERLQLRGKVGFATTGDGGTLLRRLKLDVSRFLGVWTAEPPMDGFGWSLNLNDVAALIAGLDYVRFLTEFSVLHLVADDLGAWRLFDTARAGAVGDAQVLAFREPWSLPLPMPDHWITTMHEDRSAAPSATGIGGLGIGETLVVDRVVRT